MDTQKNMIKGKEVMKILDFERSHIERATEIAMASFMQEQHQVPMLPQLISVPDLTHFADNQLGVVAFEGDQMIGYLCAYYPREDVFGTTNVRGTFTPIQAHGVIYNSDYNRERVYSMLYQGAARKWVEAGILSHCIAIYTHDKEAIHCFYYNGFGLRCIDAVQSLDEIPIMVNTFPQDEQVLEYCEVPRKEWGLLVKHHNELISHLGSSPTFMSFKSIDEEELYRRTGNNTRYFAVKVNGNYIAYVKIDTEGENFVTEVPTMMNICGAFCDINFRGSGVYHNLLSFLMATLKEEGYQYLGVDCESFNPTARGFWLKYFTEYTHSVVRRIDDKAIHLF
jgi:hypothetical protein